MYVTDEGTGNATDVSTHAGLEKWSLVGGTWVLDYVLTNGLIGVVDSSPGADGGSDGPWPSVTTIGLRNLTGVVNESTGTVTLWATTSTSSTSGDNGADPRRTAPSTAASLTCTERCEQGGRGRSLRRRPSSPVRTTAGESFVLCGGNTDGPGLRGGLARPRRPMLPFNRRPSRPSGRHPLFSR
jgi:hypothetical protein